MKPKEIDVDWDDDVAPDEVAHVSAPASPPEERFEDLPVYRPPERKASSPASSTAILPARIPPHSAEAEEYLLSCCLLDGSETLLRCKEAHITAATFYSPSNRIIYDALLKILDANGTVDIAVLASELKASRQLEAVGGIPYLTQITASVPTTAQAPYFIAKVRDLYQLRELIQAGTRAVDRAFDGTDEVPELIADTMARLSAMTTGTNGTPRKRPSDFHLLKNNHPSVLLGKRYLNRGDGIILSGTSGMGKSSMELQMAIMWALGRDFHGILPNGPQRSLIVQSEDSDGDIAEVVQSICHVLKLSSEDRALIDANILIVTDRVNRGTAFLAALRRQIADFKPDIVWINPLQAFIDGDVTDSRDIGNFLRSGLNGLNKDCLFGYIIVHHTTKPATGKDKAERLWHEVMYDMAGGAELINWARGIISLRPQETEGEFKMVLAKRGRRAGVVKQVEQGAGYRLEPVTTIGLKHRHGAFLPGTDTPVIFWDPCEVKSEKPVSSSRQSNVDWNDYKNLFPPHADNGQTIGQLSRTLLPNGSLSATKLREACNQWVKEGQVEVIDRLGAPRLYRKAK